MRPPNCSRSVFSLDVIVHDVVTQEAVPVSGHLAGDNLAIACRFLDYPLIFIRPRSNLRDNETIKFNNGKSCALSEVPLYVLLFDCTRPAQPTVLGAGATQMQLDRSGSSKPGDQHLVALYDPSGKRLGHARLRAHLRHHGSTMAAHLPQPLQPEPNSLRKKHNTIRTHGGNHHSSRKGRTRSKKVHHRASPPKHRSACRGHSRVASRGRQPRCQHCSRGRPVTGPERRGQEHVAPPPADANPHSLSAPSTPWHRQADGADEAAVKRSVPQVHPCAAHHTSKQPAEVCDNPAPARAPDQNSQGPHSMQNCTVCGSGHHFKTPAMQDITAVACEMMTLVSMRTAMSEVLGNLVHKWRDVMPSSLDLPGMMRGEAGAQKGACMQSGEPANDWTIPACTDTTSQTKEGAVDAEQLQPANRMLLRRQPSELSPTPPTRTQLQRRCTPHGTETHGEGVVSQNVSNTEPANLCGAATTKASRGTTSKERQRRREVKATQKEDLARDDSMSGPFQVTFSSSVLESSETRRRKRSSRHSRSSHKQHAENKAQPSAATIPEHQVALDPVNRQQCESVVTQEVNANTGSESAVSVATAGCAPVGMHEPTATLQQCDINAPVMEVSAEERQEVGKGVSDRKAHEVSSQPVQSQGSRSESYWPLSDDDIVQVTEDSTRNGAGQVQVDESENAVLPVDGDTIATNTHRTIPSSQGSEVKSSRDASSKYGGGKARSDGKENSSERSQAVESTDSKPSESARTVADSDACAPSPTQEPTRNCTAGIQSTHISADTSLADAASRIQSKAASSILSRQRSAISVSSMSGSLITDGTVSLNGSLQFQSRSDTSDNSKSFVTTSSLSDGSSAGRQSSPSCSNVSTSINSECAEEYTHSGSPRSTADLEEASHIQNSGQRFSGSPTGSVKTSRSNTYTSGYTRATDHTIPETFTDGNGREHAAAATSAADSNMHLDSSLHGDGSATEHRYQSETDTYEGQTSSGGESCVSVRQPASAALGGWHHPSAQLPYAQHMPQFQHMSQLHQMQYMHQMQDSSDPWNMPQVPPWNSRMHMLGQDGMAMYPDQELEHSDVDTKTISREHSARLSEIDRSLAGTTMRSGIDSSSADYSMESDDSTESGASLEP